MTKIFLAAMVTSVSFCALASASNNAEIVRGFRSADGHVLVEMTSKMFPSGNVFFLGDTKKLSQLELTWDDANGDERMLSYVACEDGESSEITLTAAGASVQNGLRLGHPHVDAMTPMSASQLKSVSKASLQMLPTIWKSKYLFQSARTGEYLLVKEPVFNFHGNYRVFMGDLNDMKEIPVKIAENWKEAAAGNIAFESGGGLFIPKIGENLSTVRPTQAEMPTLVRSNSSNFEILKVPKLAPVQLARLGFVREQGDLLAARR
jgi:hypothetical protein